MCVSHDGRSVATADTLDALRFWNMFDDSLGGGGGGGGGDDAVDDDAALANTVVGPLIGVPPLFNVQLASSLIMQPPKRQRRRISQHTARDWCNSML
jgi:hypothetical protein